VSQVLTSQEVTRILDHMNGDHADAILLYARVFGGREDAQAARMTGIEPEQMHLRAEVGGRTVELSIPFEKSLVDAHDAHMTLVRMAKTARRQAG